ncbi:DUF6545 domain-containing protein [Mycolicibacterium sp.]|uniref:DUF6545 domain-containing protein n=1 Tax=Mycolicibacterium sp. TaxID=2320850 RepID=UPI00355CCBF4
MTATVPAAVAWPLIAFMVTVVCIRYAWFNGSAFDTYLNNTLAFMLLAQLLREHEVEQILERGGLIDVTTAQQLSFVAMVFAATEFIGFTLLWSNQSPPKTRRQHRRYRLAAGVLSAAYLVAATRARLAGETLEVSGGWDGVIAWAFYLAMLFVLSAQLLWMCVAELRRGAARRERLVAMCGLTLGIMIGSTTFQAMLLAVTDQLGWTSTIGYRHWFHGYSFFYEAVGTSVMAAVPCVMALRAYCGQDSTSRNWRKLQQLRMSTRAAIPESAFDIHHDSPNRRKTPLQLHQTTVEIRDAILQLRPYFRDIPKSDIDRYIKANAVPPRHRDAAVRALHLSHAAGVKIAGGTPDPIDVADIVKSRSTTLAEETAELVRLARWWPAASEAAETLTDTAKASSTQ